MKTTVASFILAASSLLALAPGAHAIVRRDDVADANYRALGLSSDFAAVGFLNLTGGSCTATLIGDRYVLTAAHCVTGSLSPTTFLVGGSTYTVASKTVHPGWTGSLVNGFDVAVLTLATAVTGVTPLPLYSGGSELGQTATHIGFGGSGLGSTGWTVLDSLKRGANNVVDITGSTLGMSDGILISDFDSPSLLSNSLGFAGSDANPLPLEGSIAPGDSGGPLLLNNGGVWQIAGVHSFIGAFNPPDGDGVANANYSDIMGSARVSSYKPFIQSVVVAAPEPGSAAMLAGAGALGLLLRRKGSR